MPTSIRIAKFIRKKWIAGTGKVVLMLVKSNKSTACIQSQPWTEFWQGDIGASLTSF